MKIIISCLTLILATTIAFADEPGCTEAGCHQALLERENIHPVIDDGCASCHEGGENHPDAIGREFVLNESMPGLCLQCHEIPLDLVRTHQPVRDGKCTQCHSPHASDYSSLLISSQPGLCVNCHSGSKDKIDFRKKLSAKNEIHPPIEDGCTSCHNPHGSEFNKLLADAYPDGHYFDGSSESVNICFGCHDSAIMEQEDASTGFRDGETNLHSLHLAGDKGRSCGNCHDVHASPLTHFIAEKVKFGDWQMPLTFVENENGGSCTPGCHTKLVYNRE
jgi:predicted CXXCH cytochrome family protein